MYHIWRQCKNILSLIKDKPGISARPNRESYIRFHKGKIYLFLIRRFLRGHYLCAVFRTIIVCKRILLSRLKILLIFHIVQTKNTVTFIDYFEYLVALP